MAVEPGYAAWLKAPARYVTTNVAGAATRWGDKAQNSTIISPLALKDDAQAEATRQALFLAGPLSRDRIVVKGLRHDLIGTQRRIRGDRLGYETAPICFVIGAAEAEDGRTTTLTVLRRGA